LLQLARGEDAERPAAADVHEAVSAARSEALECDPLPSRPQAVLDALADGRIDPGKVLDCTVGLDSVPDGYRAMADRESIKVMVTP